MQVNLSPARHTAVTRTFEEIGPVVTYRIRAASEGVRLICFPAVSWAATSTSEGARARGSGSLCSPFFSTELEESDMMEPS